MESTQQDDQPLNQSASAGWQILGELELPAVTSADDIIDMWLTEVLSPLTLHADFRNKILNSAQQTAARILRADGEIRLEHIHLLIFAPSDRASNKQTWGFFSVERLEDTQEGLVANDHTIEIYLYMEGEDIPTRGNK